MDVINAEAGQRGHQVLDRRDLDVVLDQGRTQHRLPDQPRVGGNVYRVIEVHSSKVDSGVLRGGSKRHVDLFARVETHTRRADRGLECALSQHVARKGSTDLKNPTIISLLALLPQGG